MSGPFSRHTVLWPWSIEDRLMMVDLLEIITGQALFVPFDQRNHPAAIEAGMTAARALG